jgi:type IV pilus assembly protein PilE
MKIGNISMRKSMRGVTLMELMVVVVIIGVLTAIAYPNYRQYAARAKRNEARAALLQIATNQEKFYLQNNTYTEDLTRLGFPTTPTYTTDTGSYLVRVNPGTATPNSYTATATYLNADEEAGKCATFTIDAQGAKGSGPLGDCWSRTR